MSSPDPTSGGLGQAASELLKEMHKAQAEMQQLEQKQKADGPNAAFQQAMESQQTPAAGDKAVGKTQSTSAPAATQATQNTQAVKPGVAVTNVLRQARAEQAQTTSLQTTKRTGEAKKSAFMRYIDQIVAGQDKMTGIMNTALSGKQFNATELLGMQAGIYRYSQELDLTGKVVQQATSAIKQTLNTQV